MKRAVHAGLSCALLLGLAGCDRPPKFRDAHVWDPVQACWEPRRLDHALPYLGDEWVLYAVDEEGVCWRIEGNPLRPTEWGPQPVTVAAACGEARYSEETCEDTGA